MPFTYDYPRPAVTADTVVLAFEHGALEVLLIQRGHEPFEDHWALPGGFVEMDETLEASARRELDEETGLRPGRLEQVHTFGDPGRDPRGRVVTVAFLALIRRDEHAITAAGSPDTAIVLRSGSDSEMMSILSREEADIIGDAAGIARSADGADAAA